MLLASLVLIIAPKTALAQDSVRVGPKNYKVKFKNEQVRVLRIRCGPHEKSVIHVHPAVVAMFLTDGYTKFTMLDGRMKDQRGKPGETKRAAAEKHLPEDVGDKPVELVLVELKSKPAKTK